MIKQIVHIESCGSTNAEVFRYHAKMQNKTPFVLYCDTQSKGRGMGKNTWDSQSKKNLTCSIVQYPAFLSPYRHFYFSMTVALSIHDTLKNMGLNSRIKWPNDLLVNNQKICGILIESEMQNDNIRMMVAGIGININQTDFPAVYPKPVSLKSLGISHTNPKVVLNALVSAFDDRYRQIESENYSEIKQAYLKRLIGFHEWKRYETNNEVFKARITDVQDNGFLCLKHADGTHSKHEM